MIYYQKADHYKRKVKQEYLHEIIKIPEHSHFAQQLLKEDQVFREKGRDRLNNEVDDNDRYYMW